MKTFLIIDIIFVFFSVSFAQSRIHVVQRGETMASVATKYGTTEATIRNLNPNMGTMFFAGMKLNVPENALTETSSSVNNSYNTPIKESSNILSEDHNHNETLKNKLGLKASTDTNMQSQNISQISSTVQDGSNIHFEPRHDLGYQQLYDHVFTIKPYTLYVPGSRLEYVICNYAGEPIETFTESVSNVEAKNGLLLVTVLQSLASKAHKKSQMTKWSKGLETYFITEIDYKGTYHLTHDIIRDNWATILKRDGYAALLSSNLTSGMQINSSTINEKISAVGGVKVSPKVEYSNVRVEGFETVTTPAGTYECVKITGRVTQTARFVITQTVSYDFTWWMTRGIGFVKCLIQNIQEKPSGLIMTPPYMIYLNKTNLQF